MKSGATLRVTLHGKRPTAPQRDALAYAKKHVKRLMPTLLDAIVEAYPTLREWKKRPKTMTRARLRKLVELWGLTVLRDHHGRFAYVGYDFTCRWDPSGIVVLMHGDRVVRTGGLDALEQPVPDPAREAPKPKELTAAERRRLVATARKRAAKNPRTPKKNRRGDVVIVLPAWAGFRAGEWAKPSTGECLVSLDDESPAATLAYRRIMTHQTKTQRILLAAIGRGDPEKHIELLHIHIRTFVGYQFACDWDEEHGLGVRMHGDRVAEVGQADTAFTL